jgi:Flp pilus assembly protein TadD
LLTLAAATAQQHGSAAIAQASVAKPHPCPPPNDISDALEKASALMEQSQFAEAAAVLQNPAFLQCDPRADLLIAAAFEGRGDTALARDTLNQAHNIWPSDDGIATSLARYDLAAGQIDKAAIALQHFRATPAMPWQEIQMAAVVLLASHQLTSAEATARTGYKAHPSIQSLLLLANTIQLEGRYKDVIALLGGKRDAYNNDPAFLVTLAESEFDSAIYDGARSDAEHAISLNPNIYAAHYLLGNLFLKLGDPDSAAAQYRIGLQLEPNQPRTYYYLALALRAQHNEASEESILAKAIALDNRYALAHCEMGRIYLNQNRLPDAVAQLKLAIDDNASSEQAYYLLARAYDRLGDKASAQEMSKQLTLVRRAKHQPSDHLPDAAPVQAP